MKNKMLGIGINIAIGCLLTISNFVFAESDAVMAYKAYVAEMKSANSPDEVTKIEKKYTLENYLQNIFVSPGIDRWKIIKSTWGSEITNVEEYGNIVMIEYKEHSVPVTYSEATLINKDGIWKIKEISGTYFLSKAPIDAIRKIEQKNGKYYKNDYFINGEYYNNNYVVNCGRLKAEYPIKDGKIDGIAKLYYRSGNLWCYEPYKNGLMDGVKKCYFDGTDCLQEETSFKRGSWDGPSRIYTSSGTISFEKVYKDGKLVTVNGKPVIE